MKKTGKERKRHAQTNSGPKRGATTILRDEGKVCDVGGGLRGGGGESVGHGCLSGAKQQKIKAACSCEGRSLDQTSALGSCLRRSTAGCKAQASSKIRRRRPAGRGASSAPPPASYDADPRRSGPIPSHPGPPGSPP